MNYKHVMQTTKKKILVKFNNLLNKIEIYEI